VKRLNKFAASALHVEQELRRRLDAFAELVRHWNATVNLIAPGDLGAIWTRHIEDCLQLVPLVPAGAARAIDLGSGGGFPGLVIAIATGISFDLIESDRRKAAFLREAVRATGAPATVHPSRIETAAVPPAPLVTARALARLPRLLELAAPKLAPGGTCLFMKGAAVEAELTEAAARWQMRVERIPSRTDPAAAILRISEIARAARD
jgi:16S rRNA (guanine527-N7)-methyltransferase